MSSSPPYQLAIGGIDQVASSVSMATTAGMSARSIASM